MVATAVKKDLHPLQKPCFLLSSNDSCVNILEIRLAHLKMKNVADVVLPDQAIADAGHCREQLQEM